MFLQIALYSFLAVVVVAAIICLLALIGKVRVPEYYQKKLFALVVLAIVSLVLTQVRELLAKPKIAVSEDVLLSSKGSWDWSYPEKSWRTEVFFSKDKSGITVAGTTYLCRAQEKIPVIQWNSTQPIQPSGTGNSLTFEVTRQWTKEAASEYPELQYEVGKQFDGTLTISAEVALRGVWRPKTGTTQPWDVVLNQRGQ